MCIRDRSNTATETHTRHCRRTGKPEKGRTNISGICFGNKMCIRDRPYLFHHFTNNSQLLEVFLAEISTGRVYNHKQLAHYLAYSIKMSWTETAFHQDVYKRQGLWKGMTRSFHKAFQGSRLKGSPKRYLSPKQASRNPYIY